MKLHPKITRKQFQEDLRGIGALYSLVSAFLRKNKKFAFTRGEIANQTKLPVEKLVYPLTKLRKEKKALHKHYYWMWKK